MLFITEEESSDNKKQNEERKGRWSAPHYLTQ